MVRHVAARKTHQRLQKYSFITLKRPFQHYRHKATVRQVHNLKVMVQIISAI